MRRSGYDVYIGKCLLPVTPEKIQVKISGNNKTYTLVNEGQINVLKKAKLTEIEFECSIPQVRHPYAVYKGGFTGAKYFLNYFEKCKTGKKKVQFIVCRRLPSGKSLFNTNIKVSVEDYTITDDVGEGFDLTVKLKLKQWRSYGTQTVTIQQPATETKTATATTETARETENSPAPASTTTYTVKSGDCLWNIAKKFYGSGAQYTKIYEQNKGVVGSNPNLIYPGQVLTIPS
jgi:LysM repeat protein